jgi:DNA-binding NarL/FixJ family response regulator
LNGRSVSTELIISHLHSGEEGFMKTRVLIVDDHAVFRNGLKAMINIQSDMEVVGEAENGKTAVALTRELLPDVILMDVKMPVMDGTEATSRILAENPRMKILALSIYANDEFMASMMRAGALGYILKGCDSEELYGAIRKEAGSRNF